MGYYGYYGYISRCQVAIETCSMQVKEDFFKIKNYVGKLKIEDFSESLNFRFLWMWAKSIFTEKVLKSRKIRRKYLL